METEMDMYTAVAIAEGMQDADDERCSTPTNIWWTLGSSGSCKAALVEWHST
jgi:hypothetical protein